MADVPFTLAPLTANFWDFTRYLRSDPALISGGIAGTTVDCALHPLDTFRTRLQSEKGFWASGGCGFRGAYKGILSAAMGSAPGAAMFFSTYETMKKAASYTAMLGPAAAMPGESGVQLRPWVGSRSCGLGQTSLIFVAIPKHVAWQVMKTMSGDKERGEG
eukprot:Skav204725  [mRNA]  locus=scaffold1549:219351:220506:+ [translate_table: standard]